MIIFPTNPVPQTTTFFLSAMGASSHPARMGCVGPRPFCNGGPMRRMVVSSAGAGYGFLVDEEGAAAPGRVRAGDRGPHGAVVGHGAGGRVPTGLPGLRRGPRPGARRCGSPTPTAARRPGSSCGTSRWRARPPTSSWSTPIARWKSRLCFRAEDQGVLRQWATVTNRQPGPVTLFEVAAASPMLAARAPHLTHFGGGDWAAEWTTTTELLTPGTKIVESRGGVQPHLRSCPFFLLARDGAPQETSGTVLAGALAWGGNTRFAFERTAAPAVRVWCGHNPMAAEYVLDPDATFTTPEQIWAWSREGVGSLSRRLHRWVRSPRGARRRRAASDRGRTTGRPPSSPSTPIGFSA